MEITYTITATREKKLEVIHACLCDGLPFFVSYGFTLDYSDGAYREARAMLDNPCLEDVQIQMLRNGQPIRFVNDEDADESVNLTLELIERNWDKIPAEVVKEFIDEDYDANTTDKVMQYILFGELRYG